MIKKSITIFIGNFIADKHKIPLFENYLNEDELNHANTFITDTLRGNYIICRGKLKELLSSFLQIPPSEIQFIYSLYGKPELNFSSSICFNVSHTNEQYAIAVSEFDIIGIDIEKIKDIEIFEIAKEVFTQNEILRLKNLPENLRLPEFYRMWTIKEAFIKAIGKGFSFDPKLIEIDEDMQTFIQMECKIDKYEHLYFSQFFMNSSHSLAIVSPVKNPHIIYHF